MLFKGADSKELGARISGSFDKWDDPMQRHYRVRGIEMELGDRLIEFGFFVRNGEYPSETVVNDLFDDISDIEKEFRGGHCVRKDVAAVLFDFAATEPTNKYGKYSEEEFDEVFSIWMRACDQIRDFLNG